MGQVTETTPAYAGSTPPRPPPTELRTALREADGRLLRTVDGLDDRALGEPSLLPGWSRAHVVAHLVLHGEAVGGVLEGVVRGEEVPMYPSQAERDHAVDELAGAGGAELRGRLLETTGRFRDVLDRLSETQWDGLVRRLPGAQPFPARDLPVTRLREVEVHHADLGTGYSCDDWPTAFAVDLVDTLVVDRAGQGPLGLVAGDLDRTWWVGGEAEDACVADGPVRRLAWWLLGRGDREGIHLSPGRPPGLGRWR